VPRAQVQAARAAVETARAQIQASEAAVEAAKAALASSEVDRGFTRLTAPIDGIAGIASTAGGGVGESMERTGDNGIHDRSNQGLFHRERA
jgi:multidrug efflux pump subunit AcrA (membrane-fusion protein)